MTTHGEALTAESAELAASARRIRVGGGWAILGRTGIALFGFLTITILSRLLDPDQMGAYFLAFSLVSAGALLGQMGLDLTVVRLVAEAIGDGDQGRARLIIKKVLFWGCAGAIGVAAVLNLGAGRWITQDILNESILAEHLWWVGAWVIVLAIETLLANIFRGFHDIRLAVTFAGLARSVLSALVFACLWVFQGHSDLSQIIVLSVGVGAASTMIGMSLLRHKTRGLGFEVYGSADGIFLIAMPLLVHTLLLYVVSQVNLWVLGAFRPHEEVALYGAAVRLVLLVGMSTSIVNAVVPPLIAEKHSQGKLKDLQDLLRSAATVCGVPALAVLACYVLWGGWFLDTIFGDFYREAAVALTVLSVAEIVNVLTGPCTISLVMTGNQLPIMLLTIARALATVSGSIVVVTEYGVVGVAFVYAICLIVYNIASLLIAKRILGIWTHAGLSTVIHIFRK